MEIAIGIPDYSCLFLSEADKKQRRMTAPPHKLTHWSGGRGCNQGVGEQGGSPEGRGGADSSIEMLTEDRRGRPACP